MQESAIGRVSTSTLVSQQAQRWYHGAARFARVQPLGTLGLLICLVTIFIGVFAPLLDRYDPNRGDYSAIMLPPSASHWFGTDDYGRDLYSRVVHGARVSLNVAFFSIVIGTTSGYILGIFSGYIGGMFDLLLQRIVDAWLSFPSLLLALVIVSVFPPSINNVILAISVGLLPRATRISRGVAMSAKENVYVDAARVIGASPLRVMLRHILPNVMAPYVILASISLGGAILVEASLSYLGLGVPPPYASWGRMLSGAAQSQAVVAP
ncbi:MAG: ABC transporter permease, partial [Chloroflexota bacterium]